MCLPYVHLAFRYGTVSLVPRPGKLAELSAELADLLAIGEATTARVLSLCGSLMFLILACFSRIGRGSLQPLFWWVANHLASEPRGSPSTAKYEPDPQAIAALVLFQFAIRNLSSREFQLSRVHRPPLIAYSDAGLEIQSEPCDSTRMLGISKGLGGILFDGDSTLAAAAQCPDDILVGLRPRKTQIIPVELLAAAGLMFTFAEAFLDRDVIFFIDNQAVCAALCKGASRSDDIQAFTTAFHTMVTKLHARVWFEWVPSQANPADELSRRGSSPFVASSEVHPLRLPARADRRRSRRLADVIGLAQAVTPGPARPLRL